MGEQSTPSLPMSAAEFLEFVKTGQLANLKQTSPSDIVRHTKATYLKPNWSHWWNMAEVSLQQAVWLSLDFEPCKKTSAETEAIQNIIERAPPVVLRHYTAYLLEALCDDYQPRMAQCLAAIKAKTLPVRWRNNYDAGLRHDLTVRWHVSLDQFRQWGESLPVPYTFPDEFPRPAAAAPKIPAKLADKGALTPYASPPAAPTSEPSMFHATYGGGVTWVDAEYDEKLKAALSPPEASKASDDEKPLDPRERTTMVRIICALMAMAEDQLPEGKETTIIENQIALLGFDRPKEAAIRRALQVAKAEKPENPRRA